MLRRFAALATIVLTLSVTNIPDAAPVVAAPLSAGPVRGVARAAVRPVQSAAPFVRRAGRVLDVGHRGTRAYAPENTIAAFREGAKRHADAIEFDVQQTKDHKLIVMHDTTLARTTNVEKVFPKRSPWRVGDFTLKEIKRLDAGSWFAARYKGERIPTLGETLRAMDGTGVGLLLEAKKPELYPGMGPRVAAELRANPGWLIPGRLIVQSFNWGFMKSFHALMPDVTDAVIGTPSARQLTAVRKYADLVNPNRDDVTRSYVQRVHKLGLELYAWTVDDPDIMRRLVSDDVDGIISNRPDVVYRVVSG